MTTLMTQSVTKSIAITVTVDRDAAYVESSLGERLTANILREIADDLDPACGSSGPSDA